MGVIEISESKVTGYKWNSLGLHRGRAMNMQVSHDVCVHVSLVRALMCGNRDSERERKQVAPSFAVLAVCPPPAN